MEIIRQADRLIFERSSTVETLSYKGGGPRDEGTSQGTVSRQSRAGTVEVGKAKATGHRSDLDKNSTCSTSST